MMFRCERCETVARYTSWVTSRWHLENRIQRCERCGTPHSCAIGREASVISPPLTDIHDVSTSVISPWVDSRYTPYRAGVYECEFRDGLSLRLVWSGAAWTWTGLVVDTTQLLKWRGKWQRSPKTG